LENLTTQRDSLPERMEAGIARGDGTKVLRIFVPWAYVIAVPEVEVTRKRPRGGLNSFDRADEEVRD